VSDFKKTERQKQGTTILASDARYILLEGGGRSGKTTLIVYAILVRACKEKSTHCILRLNHNAAKRSIWNKTLPDVIRLAFPELREYTEKNKNNTELIMNLPNGSQILVGGLDDAKRAEKVLGLEFTSLFLNEVSQIPFDAAQIAISRLAEKNSLKKKVYLDQNPGKKSSWPYLLFHKKLNPTDQEPLKDPDDYANFLMNPKDNLENIDKDYLRTLESMPVKDRERFMEGIYQDESEGQVYRDFRADRHVMPLEKQNGTLFALLDFNVSPGTAVIAQYINNKLYCLDEVWILHSDTYRVCAELKAKGAAGASCIPDSTGANRKTSGKSDFDILKEAGFKIMSVANPFVTDRINNVNRMFSDDRIVIDPKCKKLINDLEAVVWKNNRPDQSSANKLLTHASDCLGYGAWYFDPIASIKLRATSSPR